MKRKFTIPTKEEVPEHDRKIFYLLEESMGFVPNVYAFLSHSRTALKSFLTFGRTPTVFTDREAEVIHLVTSQINKCQYCLSAHTASAKKAGFTDEQVLAIRKGSITFDPKLGILAVFTCELVNRGGHVSSEITERFYGAGYTDAHLVDLVMLVARTTATNYINNVTQNPIDFPEVPIIICDCDCRGK